MYKYAMYRYRNMTSAEKKEKRHSELIKIKVQITEINNEVKRIGRVIDAINRRTIE